MSEKLLEINNLIVEYTSSHLGKKTLTRAVDNVSLNINKGEIFAIAGESGCGKSTLSKSIIRLVDRVSGEIKYAGKDINGLDKSELMSFREKVQMIFQNPYASLNPKMKIKDILAEPLIINKKFSKIDISKGLKEKIEQVGLSEAQLELYPHEFSGGQRQRIAIARALMLNPEFIIADEPVSALDASIQAQIINLIIDMKQEYDITMLFISHDLNVIRYLADRIGIMYLGELVEVGTCEDIFNNPQHPYTKLLLNSIPNIHKQPDKVDLTEIPSELPKGCKFYSRCHNVDCFCQTEKPSYKNLSSTHKVLCSAPN